MTRYTDNELRSFEAYRLCEIVAALQDELDDARGDAMSVESYARDRALSAALESDAANQGTEAILKEATVYLNFLLGRDG